MILKPEDVPRALRLLSLRQIKAVRRLCELFGVDTDRFDDVVAAFEKHRLSEGETLTTKGLYILYLGLLPVGSVDLPARYPQEVLEWGRERDYISDDARVGTGRRGTPKPGFKIIDRIAIPEITLADHR